MLASLSRFRHAASLWSAPIIYPKLVFSARRVIPVITRPIQTHQQVGPELPLSTRIEEETLPDYKSERYYPIQIGDTFQSRYQIITKLGYGTASTAWLCRDQLNDRYLTLKAHVRTKESVPEIEISKHLGLIEGHVGAPIVRVVTDWFEVQGEHGSFPFLLYPPAGVDLDEVMHMYEEKMLDEDLLKAAVRDILVGMDFLHTANVIHTDLHPSNILLGIGEGSILSELELAEKSSPSARKIMTDRTLYLSRYMPVTYGRPLISDLGEARIALGKQTGLVMPDIYRAPEVMLGMDWDREVDIWAMGQTVWSLLQGIRLFDNRDSTDHKSRARRLAEMISLMGPPPAEFLQRSPDTRIYWHEDGTWKDLVPIPNTIIETRERRLTGDQKAEFLQFIRKTLQWLPEDRPTAEELVFDDWVRGELY